MIFVKASEVCVQLEFGSFEIVTVRPITVFFSAVNNGSAEVDPVKEMTPFFRKPDTAFIIVIDRILRPIVFHHIQMAPYIIVCGDGVG